MRAPWRLRPLRLLVPRRDEELVELNVAEAATVLGLSALGFAGEDHTEAALFAVRSELGACAARIQEAEKNGRWWHPDTDPLPATKWDQHFAALSDSRLSELLNAAIDRAYQRCDRLNHRTRDYMEA